MLTLSFSCDGNYTLRCSIVSIQHLLYVHCLFPLPKKAIPNSFCSSTFKLVCLKKVEFECSLKRLSMFLRKKIYLTAFEIQMRTRGQVRSSTATRCEWRAVRLWRSAVVRSTGFIVLTPRVYCTHAMVARQRTLLLAIWTYRYVFATLSLPRSAKHWRKFVQKSLLFAYCKLQVRSILSFSL